MKTAGSGEERGMHGVKIKGRNCHIVVDTLGNILAIIVHRANLHDTKAGVMAARLAIENYPSIKAFCTDAGCCKTFEADVANELGRKADISEKIVPGWHIIPKHWKAERAFAWLNNYRRLSKDYEKKVVSPQAMCTIASIHHGASLLMLFKQPLRS